MRVPTTIRLKKSHREYLEWLAKKYEMPEKYFISESVGRCVDIAMESEPMKTCKGVNNG